jgi:hypothetical protein
MDESQPISIIDDSELETAVTKGLSDEKLKESIVETWEHSRKRPKRQKAVEHDAGLLWGGRFLRQSGKNCWILTLDRTLHEYDLRHTSKTEYPLVLSLDALIQILALQDAGPDFEPSAFAPLMASIISYQFEPTLETYTVEDLEWLLDIEERCADLPTASVEALALSVNHARLSGKPHDDPELILLIQRAFQGEKLHTVNDLAKAQQLIKSKDAQLQDELQKRALVEGALRSQLKSGLLRAAKRRAINSAIRWISSFVTLGIVVVGATYFIAGQSIGPTFWAGVVSGLSCVVGCLYAIFQSVLPDYKTDVDQVEQTVEQQLRDLEAK